MPSLKPASCVLVASFILMGCDSKPLELPGDGGVDLPPEPEPEPIRSAVLERVRISSDPEAEYHQRVDREIAFDQRAVRATLEVALESPCYPFEDWQASEIPEGHNWPEDCDAFDRSLTVSLDDPASTGARPPGLELLRAVTPFGGPARFEADVTDVVNSRPGAHRLRVEIGTYGDPEGQVSGARGEWIVSVTLALTPGEPERRVLAVEPLFFDIQTETLREPVAFRVPEGTRSGRIDYRVTGHGSALDPRCLGPAEEFCRRTHAVSLDGAPLLDLEPWRSDCAALCSLAHFEQGDSGFDYCAENPCGAPESVRASRANWCPGSVTPAFEIEAPELSNAGDHELGVEIRELFEGGSWIASATFFAYE